MLFPQDEVGIVGQRGWEVIFAPLLRSIPGLGCCLLSCLFREYTTCLEWMDVVYTQLLCSTCLNRTGKTSWSARSYIVCGSHPWSHENRTDLSRWQALVGRRVFILLLKVRRPREQPCHRRIIGRFPPVFYTCWDQIDEAGCSSHHLLCILY